MNFLSPERFVWLAIALPVVIFYVLRTRLRSQPVSTLLFWEELFDEKRTRSWWQRLRHWLSLLLQLAFLGFLVFAIVDPLWSGAEAKTRQTVIVLDNSASMQVTGEEGESRFDQALNQARLIVEAMRDRDELAIVATGGSVTTAIGMTDFGPAALDAIDQIKMTDSPTRIDEAIEAARQLTRDPERREIIVISDGCHELDSETASSQDLRLIRVGESADNVAITNLAVRRSTVDPIGYAALIEVQNFADEEADFRLSIDLNEELVDVIPLKLAANEVWRKTITQASSEGGVLQVQIDLPDGLPLDNQARAVLPSRPRIPVTLISNSPNVYLESVLQAIPLVDLSTPTKIPDQSPAGGFLVLHQKVPAPFPKGAVMVIDPSTDGEFWKLAGSRRDAIVASQDTSSPLMPHVRLDNVLMPSCQPIEVDDQAAKLLTSADGSTLMASIRRDQHRVLVLAADLNQTDLPLRIAFPVLMTNAVNWFLGRTGEMRPSLPTGEMVDVPVDAKNKNSVSSEANESLAEAPENWVWTDDEGIETLATVQSGIAKVGPVNQAGLITLSPAAADSFDQAIRVAVNLFNASESDLRVRESDAATSPARSPASGRSLWFYLTCVALGLIVTEWFLFQRRIVA